MYEASVHRYPGELSSKPSWLEQLRAVKNELATREDLLPFQPPSEVSGWETQEHYGKPIPLHGRLHIGRTLVWTSVFLKLFKHMPFSLEDRTILYSVASTHDRQRKKDFGKEPAHQLRAANPSWLETVLPENARQFIPTIAYINRNHDMHGKEIEPTSDEKLRKLLTMFQNADGLEVVRVGVRFPFAKFLQKIPSLSLSHRLSDKSLTQLAPLAEAFCKRSEAIWQTNKGKRDGFLCALDAAEELGLLQTEKRE